MQPEPVIYVNVDIAFLTNWITDLAWLWATSSLAGLRPRLWRLATAAATGAVLAVWAYFPGGRWLSSLPGAVVGTAVLLALAFLPCRVHQGLRVLAYFLLSGGAMAGVVLLTGPRQGPLGGAGPSHREFPGTVVAAGLLLCLAGARYLWESARDRSRLARGLYSLRITIAGRSLELAALVDTGNALKDPLSGVPVAVVEALALESLLPAAVLAAAAAGWDALDGLPASWAARCRLVPYRAVGRPVGILLALAPDVVALKAPGTAAWRRVRGLVGLAADRLHPDGAYRALLSPAMVDDSISWEGETG